MVVAFVLLAAALLSLWLGGDKRLGRAPLWAWLAAGALGAALAAGVVRPLGALGVAAWAGVVAWWSREAASRWSRGAAAGAVLGLATALFMHRVPGFANPRVIDAVRFTPDAVPFSLHLNFDKALVGLLLLAWAHPRIASARDRRSSIAITSSRRGLREARRVRPWPPDLSSRQGSLSEANHGRIDGYEVLSRGRQ